MSVVIIVTGGAVRLTGSGLGCDTWPKCTDDSLYRHLGDGRARRDRVRQPDAHLRAQRGRRLGDRRGAFGEAAQTGLSRLAWSQFWLVMGNAVIGGITVLTGLNPYSVAGHFLLATRRCSPSPR